MPQRSIAPAAHHQEDSFLDGLHDWMERAPWIALSAVAHALVLLVLAVIPWDLLEDQPEKSFVATVDQLPDEVFEPPPPEPEPEDIEEEPIEEPVLEPVLLPTDDVSDDLSEAPADDAGPTNDFDTLSPTEVPTLAHIGIGGGPKLSGRFKDGPGGRGQLGRNTIATLEAGLDWLARHQSADGGWDADGFDQRCGALGATPCDGHGQSAHDVGVTALALLAFLGDGHTTSRGRYQEVVVRGAQWLKQAQDPESGLIGDRLGHGFVYNHAIATLALTEVYYFSKSPLHRMPAQRAVDYIARARNPYGAWRYDVPPIGDSDTSITGWMVLALKSAEDAGLDVDRGAYAGALSWLDEVTDPATGRTGYDTVGSLSSRIARVNDHYPAEKGEAMTAVSLLCRFFLGQNPDEHPLMRSQAQLLLQRLPEWDPDGFGCDMYYWYYGSYAMYQMGGSAWTDWRRAMERAVLASQRREGDQRGSWDPVGPWGYAGGRVYSTALMTLCLEACYRYARVLGGR